MKQISETVLELDENEVEFHERSPVHSHANVEESELKQRPDPQKNNGVIIGVLTGFGESGVPLVNFSENQGTESITARSTATLSVSEIGHEVVLMFEHGDLSKPIIVGCVQPQALVEREQPFDVKLDGEQLTLSAEREIVLRCGKSSITLTRAGKVLIRGAYLLSRSSGVNRIKGGSVQIN
jgi:Domain of unknown function (DUF6484)